VLWRIVPRSDAEPPSRDGLTGAGGHADARLGRSRRAG
jgi:hypothetical protein